MNLKSKRRFFKRLKLTAFKHRFTTTDVIEKSQLMNKVKKPKNLFFNMFDKEQTEEMRMMNKVFGKKQPKKIRKKDYRLQDMRYNYTSEQKRLRIKLSKEIKRIREKER